MMEKSIITGLIEESELGPKFFFTVAKTSVERSVDT
jgi:hypothetical protein